MCWQWEKREPCACRRERRPRSCGGSLIRPQHQEKQRARNTYIRRHPGFKVQTKWSEVASGELSGARARRGAKLGRAPRREGAVSFAPEPTRSSAPPGAAPRLLVCSARLVPRLEGCQMFWVSSPMAPEEGGPCSSFSLLLSCLPLTKSISKHWLNERPLGILPGKSAPNFTFYKSVQRQWNYSAEHSNPESTTPTKWKQKHLILMLNLSLENQLLLKHTQKVETISLTDWKTSLWHSH